MRIEGKTGLIGGLPDFLVEGQIWSCLRKMFAEISQRSIEEKREALELCRVLRSLNPRWRCLVDESEEWAAYRLVNADFRDDEGNLASIRQVDQRACCLQNLV